MLRPEPSPTFSSAARYLSTAPSLKQLSTAVKLEIYGLFKCVTVSSAPNTPRPGFFDMAGRAKWDAWNEAGAKYEKISAAEDRYLEIARSLGWSEGIEPGEASSKGETESSGPPSGMGPSVSVMVRPEEEPDESVHGLTVSGRINALQALLDNDEHIDLNALDEYGYTPLHLACDRGNLVAVKLLVEHGADVLRKDSDDLTPLEVAQIAGQDAIVKYLESTKH